MRESEAAEDDSKKDMVEQRRIAHSLSYIIID
jgi:hypothetical protein